MQERHDNGRRGFTLIELLVVIGIISFLAGIGYLVSGALIRSDQAQRGGATVQSTYSIAKNQSLRDRVNYGIRLVRDANPDPNYCYPPPAIPLDIYNYVGLEYISQPPDYVQNTYENGRVLDPTDPLGIQTFSLANLIQFDQSDPRRDITGGLGAASDKRLWLVQVGDYILTQNDPTPHLITRLFPDFSQVANRLLKYNEIELASGTNPIMYSFTKNFRVIRSARAVPGEEIVKLPDDIIIDGVFSKVATSANAALTAPPPPLPDTRISVIPSVLRNPVNQYVDVLFSPSGRVLGPAASVGKVILWVRHRNAVPTIRSDGAIIAHQSKEQMLIVIYTQTGAVAAYPVDNSYRPDPVTGRPNPYLFTLEPRPVGL